MSTASEGLDILSPDIYAQGVPHERFERLRNERPISWHEEPGGPGFWAVTRYRDVLEVLRDAATFSSELGGTQIPELPRHDIRRSPDNLAVMDPPRHTQFRAIIGQAFTPSSTARMEGFIRERVVALLTKLGERGEFDFMDDFAAKLPMSTILQMVGVPTEDEAMLEGWIVTLLATDDPEYQTSEEERADTGRRFMEYAHALAASRREAPKDDLLSVLMAAEVNGTKLTYEEFGMFFMLLLAAGTHTSRLSIGNGALTLMDNPEQFARLRADPGLVRGGVEEILRLNPPLMHFRRTAKRDTELSGTKLSAGDKVVVWHISANRDAEVFTNPHGFDITRSPNDHLSFGYGPHFCPGNALARLSIRVSLEEVIKRMPTLEVCGRPERLRSNWFNGFKRMKVAVGRKR